MYHRKGAPFRGYTGVHASMLYPEPLITLARAVAAVILPLSLADIIYLNTLLFSFLPVKVKLAQSCPTLCDSRNYTVHGILQARILEWVAFPFSRGSSQPRDRSQVSRIAGGFFTSWATRKAHLSCQSLIYITNFREPTLVLSLFFLNFINFLWVPSSGFLWVYSTVVFLTSCVQLPQVKVVRFLISPAWATCCMSSLLFSSNIF